MQRVVLILPDENRRLPKAEAFRRAGFLVSAALGGDAGPRADGTDAPAREKPERAEEDEGDVP